MLHKVRVALQLRWGDFERFAVVVGVAAVKGGQFMTWSGMQSPFGGEPRGLYTRGKLYTASRKPCQSPPGPCRGGPSLRPHMGSYRPPNADQMKSVEKAFLLLLLIFSVHRNVLHIGLSLSLHAGGMGEELLPLAEMGANTVDSFLPHSKHCSAT